MLKIDKIFKLETEQKKINEELSKISEELFGEDFFLTIYPGDGLCLTSYSSSKSVPINTKNVLKYILTLNSKDDIESYINKNSIS